MLCKCKPIIKIDFLFFRATVKNESLLVIHTV